eukprot:scaffold305165_cov40-Tisochrysis_lutea.AAC.1
MASTLPEAETMRGVVAPLSLVKNLRPIYLMRLVAAMAMSGCHAPRNPHRRLVFHSVPPASI